MVAKETTNCRTGGTQHVPILHNYINVTCKKCNRKLARGGPKSRDWLATETTKKTNNRFWSSVCTCLKSRSYVTWSYVHHVRKSKWCSYHAGQWIAWGNHQLQLTRIKLFIQGLSNCTWHWYRHVRYVFGLWFVFSTIHGSRRAAKMGKAWGYKSREWHLVDVGGGVHIQITY